MENKRTVNKELQLTEAGRVFKKAVKSLLEKERPKGKPIIKKADYLLYGFEVYLYECPRCRTTWKERFNFCPECGLDWRESEVEEDGE